MTNQQFEHQFPPHVLAFVSDRSVDFARAAGPSALTKAQLDHLQENAGYALTKIFDVRQVHGERIVIASKRDPDDTFEADGVITNEKGLSIAVRTADCLPVFIFDEDNEAIGVVHCGWRGTHKKILINALDLMERNYKSRPSRLKVAFGPALRKCHYEVTEEFKSYFPQAISLREGKLFFDLIEENREQLAAKGVLAQNIFDCHICTYCDPRYFSHRRDKEGAGRMLSVMMIRSAVK